MQFKKGCKTPLSNWLLFFSYRMDATINYWDTLRLRGNTPSSPVTLNQTWCQNSGGRCYIIHQGRKLQINLAG